MSRGDGVRAELEAIFHSALRAVAAGDRVRDAVQAGPRGLEIAGLPLPAGARLRVLAVGKAAVPMAAALEERAGERIAAGLAVAPEGEAAGLRHTSLLVAAHPVPDARSERAAGEAAALVASAKPDEVLVVLLSGGASSLLTAPAAGLRQEDLARVTALLLAAGCDIGELNAVRKHLGAVSGGRLAKLGRAARVEVLALSDVPGDRIDVIGSGPFAPDPTRYADALEVVVRHGLGERVPQAVREHLEAGARGEREETPKPGDPALARVRHTLLATNRTAVEAARAAARSRGVDAPCGPALRGEARVVGRRLAALGRALRARAPLCLVAGGETVVHVSGPGRGGRNQELALAAALELAGCGGVALLAAGTDGRDGPTDAAGAFIDGGSVARGRARGVDATAALAANDSHGFFRTEGGIFRTGPTGTNVMDLVLLRVGFR